MKKLLMIFLGISLFSGCATVITGSTHTIQIDSEPSGAQVIHNGYPQGKTPCTLEISRKKNHLLLVKKEGYGPQQYELESSLNGWVMGNILTVGLGYIVDYFTGAMWNLSPSKIYVPLKEKGKKKPENSRSTEHIK